MAIGLVLLGGVAVSGVAQAAPKASIVMDLRNGKVLHARSADARRHPASLTKMMTLYLTFEAVRDGKLRLDQKVRVSRHAARQPASKLYLRAGQRVTVRSLIRATAIKSANDAAMVLAEAIGGSQKRFSQMMTRKAKALGMKNTRFRNPHGLTQSGHYSTARDMAILGRHLFFDYPKYYNIFQRKTDYAAGKRIWNTNRLLSTYSGADGIKTGYTRAAGYNLVATAHRGKKRILAVQMGANSSGDRARKVARLLDIGFARAPRSVKRVRPRIAAEPLRRGRIKITGAPLPKPRPGTDATVLAVLADILATQARAEAVQPDNVVQTAPLRADLPVPRGGRKVILVSSSFAPVRVPLPSPRPIRLAQN
jgi:D-alanyl-D-alanine carboxypeptidase